MKVIAKIISNVSPRNQKRKAQARKIRKNESGRYDGKLYGKPRRPGIFTIGLVTVMIVKILC